MTARSTATGRLAFGRVLARRERRRAKQYAMFDATGVDLRDEDDPAEVLELAREARKAVAGRKAGGTLRIEAARINLEIASELGRVPDARIIEIAKRPMRDGDTYTIESALAKAKRRLAR